MTKQTKQFLFLLLLPVVFLFSFPNEIKADNSSNISVRAILPDNQHNKDVTYYDLRVKPNQEQELELEVINSSKEEQEVNFQINNATTNETGAIDYSDRNGTVERDSSLKEGFALTDVATVDESVKIPAEGSKIVKIKVKAPAEEFDGMILGGIRVMTPEEKNETKDSGGGGMQINNRIAYSISIRLTQNDNEVKPELELNKVYPGQSSGRNVIRANVQNTTPTSIEELEYKAKIYKKGESEVIFEGKSTDYRFAPNSNADYLIGTEGKRLEAGKYTLHLTVESKATGDFWEWKDVEFEITKEEAKKLNDTAIDIDKDNTLLYILLGVGALLLLLLIFLLIFLLKRRKKKQEEERKKNRKKKRTGKKQRTSKSGANKRSREK